MITARFELVLQSFTVPTSITEAISHRAQPPQAGAPVPQLERRQFLLSEIPPLALEQMCEQFKQAVFKRAGKESYLLSGEKQYPIPDSILFEPKNNPPQMPECEPARTPDGESEDHSKEGFATWPFIQEEKQPPLPPEENGPLEVD